LTFGFNRARAGHHHKIIPADLDITNLHNAAGTPAGLSDEVEAGEMPVPFRIHERQTILVSGINEFITAKRLEPQKHWRKPLQ
jgi:hypothetical protein